MRALLLVGMIGQMARARRPVGQAVITFVAHGGTGRDLRPEVEENGELGLSLACPGVRSKATSKPRQSGLRWILVEKLPRERPSAWPSCPPCPGCRDVGANGRRVERLHDVGRAAGPCQPVEHGLEHAGPGKPPEPLPDRVPIAELGRKRSPGDVVDREVVKRLQELAVVPPHVAPARQSRPEHRQRDLPIVLALPISMAAPPPFADPL